MTWHAVTWTPDRLPELVELLHECFGEHKTTDHIRWKHLEGPWGPSRGRVALDENGRLVGVRLLTPWRVRWGSGSQSAIVLRAFDGAVSPSVRRQGVFAGLVQGAIHDETEARTGSESALAVVSTCVPASREAYRKLGWTIFEPQTRILSNAPLSTAKVDEVAAGEVPPHYSDSRIQTAWDPAALRWRTDPRAGYEYRAVRLRNGNRPNGLIFRVGRHRGIRRLVVSLVSGSLRERRQLVAAAALRHGCLVVAHDGSLAGDDGKRRLRRANDGSVLALWSPPRHTESPDPLNRASWLLQGADLEGVL